jgi:hypothetical protein
MELAAAAAAAAAAAHGSQSLTYTRFQPWHSTRQMLQHLQTARDTQQQQQQHEGNRLGNMSIVIKL